MGLLLKPPTESWQGALSGCLWASITTFSFPCETARGKKKDNHLFTFYLYLANCRIRADLILLKMKSRYSPWKVRISLMADFACSVISFGDRFYFQSPPSGKTSLSAVARCTVMFPVLFVNSFFCTLKQLRSVKFFISQQHNLLKLT